MFKKKRPIFKQNIKLRLDFSPHNASNYSVFIDYENFEIWTKLTFFLVAYCYDQHSLYFSAMRFFYP